MSRKRKQPDSRLGIPDPNGYNNKELSCSKHLHELHKLKEVDPKFYEFLQKEDADLLEFRVSDEDKKSDVLVNISCEQEIHGAEHANYLKKRRDAIEQNSTNFEKPRLPATNKDNSGRFVFDGRMLDYLQCATQNTKHVQVDDIRLAVEAFSACVSRIGADVEMPKYIINEQAVFDGTLRLCFGRLGDIFMELIARKVKVDLESDNVQESKKISLRNVKGFQAPLKQYLSGILTFLNHIQTSDVIVSTLSAIRGIVDLYALFKKIAKNLSKVLAGIWSRKSWDCRVGAYVCMMKLAKNHPEHFVVLYKYCYLGFVSNSRHVTNEAWPLLYFMHRSFAELTVLRPDLAYPYVFVYIRQIAIHLRNAIISKKRKDMVQTVYNWQVMQCLYLWTRVISKAHSVSECEAVSELCYPLTQIIYGMLKLFQSLRYIPLRLHCISLLIQLQANCGTFVPTISLAADLLDDVGLIMARRPKTLKDVKVEFECSLKISAKVLEDISWRTKLCEQLFRITLQAAHLLSAQPCFPDMIVPIAFRMRSSLRKIRSFEYVKCFRALLDKLEQHAKFIEGILVTKEFDIKDDIGISLEHDINYPDSPIVAYFRQWERVWRAKLELSTKPEHNRTDVQEEVQRPPNTTKVIDVARPTATYSVSARAGENVCDLFDDIENWSDDN